MQYEGLRETFERIIELTLTKLGKVGNIFPRLPASGGR